MTQKILQNIVNIINDNLKIDTISSNYLLNEMCIIIDAAHIVKVLTLLRDNIETQFKQLIDICAVDYPYRSNRFDVVYHLLSMKYNMRLRVKIDVGDHAHVQTISHLFNAANWYEREAFDLYGILFTGHPDLRRILTDYDFQGHPLRKDFPLTGYIEPHYDYAQKKVVYASVNLPQEYRHFDFLSPWEGMTPVSNALPGDEKAFQQDQED